MKRRKLKNGQVVTDAPKSVAMTIDSKCPKKWAFVDMETGQIWVHKSRIPKYKNYKYNNFFTADEAAIRAMENIMTAITAERMGLNLSPMSRAPWAKRLKSRNSFDSPHKYG